MAKKEKIKAKKKIKKMKRKLKKKLKENCYQEKIDLWNNLGTVVKWKSFIKRRY